jgi:hypothetical protein
MLPTPKASDGQHPGVKAHKQGQTMHLSAAVMSMATPTASACSTQTKGRSLSSEVNNLPMPAQSKAQGKLSPGFVEAMMGFPPVGRNYNRRKS